MVKKSESFDMFFMLLVFLITMKFGDFTNNLLFVEHTYTGAFLKDDSATQKLTTTTPSSINVETQDETKNEVSTTSSFSQIRKMKHFIDKTEFIVWFFTQPSTYVTLPERFGKSTQLSTLEAFVDAKFHPNGTQVKRETTLEYSLFASPNTLDGKNKSLAVHSDHAEFFKENFQGYIAVSFNFNDLAKAGSYEEFKKIFCDKLANLFREHTERAVPASDKCNGLRDALLAFSGDLVTRLKLCREIFSPGSLTEDLVIGLSKCFGKEVIVLIDEYDALLRAALSRNIPDGDLHLMNEAMQRFVTNIAKNIPDYVYTTLCVGVLNLGGTVSDWANNINHIDFFEFPGLGKFFGFSDKDVDTLFRRYNLENVSKVKDYYNGFQMPGAEGDVSRDIYSCGDILKYVSDQISNPYRSKMSAWPAIFNSVFSDVIFGEIIAEILQNAKPRVEQAIQGLQLDDILKLKASIESWHLRKDKNDLPASDRDMVLHYLIETGFLTISQKSQTKKSSHGTSNFLDCRDVPLRYTNEKTKLLLENALYSSDFNQLYFNSTPDKMNHFGDMLNEIKPHDETSYRNLLKSIQVLTIGRRREYLHLQLAVYMASRYLKVVKNKLDQYSDETNLYTEDKKHHQVIDVAVKLKNQKVGILMAFEWSQSAYHGIMQLINDDHSRIFDTEDFERYEINETHFMGIRCDEANDCSMCFLYNTTDKSKAECITEPENPAEKAKLLEERDKDIIGQYKGSARKVVHP